ncbi:MAG TPA: Ig-like domain-containing protein [Steroidobacteraceae bacterium]|nr:Ig-like domain-containing protein [Steroidobacteraceae bacterium]
MTSTQMPLPARLRPLSPLLLTAVLLAGCGGDSSNSPPTAYPQALTIDEDATTEIALSASDREGDVLTYAIASFPTNGTVQLDASSGRVLYVPDADYAGTDRFTFTAHDGRNMSTEATVAITLRQINDAPRFPDIPELTNLPDSPITQWQLAVVDPESTPVQVSLAVADPSMLEATYNTTNDTLELRPLQYGDTQVTVSASDGELSTARTFVFRVGKVTRKVELAIPDPSRQAIVITNTLQYGINVGLGWNRKIIFESRADLVNAAVSPLESDENVIADALWRFMIGHVYHNESFAAERWEHDPLLLINSIGFGLCDDVSSALAFLARERGLAARVWALGGHVAPEINVAGRWQLYDPDIKVVYHDYDARITNVETLSAFPALITSPVQPLYGASFYGYQSFIADIYASHDDNNVEPWYDEAAPAVPGTFQFPPGASVHFPGSADITVNDHMGMSAPAVSSLDLVLPAGTRAELKMPLVLLDIKGEGTIQIGGHDYVLGSSALDELFASNRAFIPGITIVDAKTPLVLTFLLNPRNADLETSTSVYLTGLEVWGLDVTTENFPDGRPSFSAPQIPTFPF